jgi:hypothetical protein
MIKIGTKTEIVGELDTVRRLETRTVPRRCQAVHGLSRRILLPAAGGVIVVSRLGQNAVVHTGYRGPPRSPMATRVVHTVSLLCHLGGNLLGGTCVLSFSASISC